MFEAFALALAASQLSAPADPRPPSLIDSGWPPQRYMGEAAGLVGFVDDVGAYCGRAPEGYVILACASKEEGVMVLPNPCAAEFREEKFARIACHEKGHWLGWPGTHGG